MIKILFFLSSHKIGLSSLLTEQALYYKQLKHVDFTFIAGENEQEQSLRQRLEAQNISYKIIHGLDEHKDFLNLIKEFKLHVDSVKPDVVHVQTNWQFVIAVATKFFITKKYKIFYTIHGYRNNHKYKSLIALLLIQLLLYFFANTVFAASKIVFQKFWLIQKKLQVLYLGVEENFFTRTSSIVHDVKSIKMIFPGQFREGKNQYALINTVAKYIHLTGDNSITLSLPGEGQLKDECLALCKKLKLEKNVIFPGHVTRDTIIQHYEACNVAVIPSNSETFGHSIAEPFVLGMCVISRNTGIAMDVIENAHNGFIFETDEELLSILVNLNQNKSLIQKCANNAFENRALFKWNTLSNQYQKFVLESMTGEHI
jgi:glycosyltransferase involved in cell wall biosynthesis